MRGDLSETPVADLCRGLSTAGATGAVEVVTPAGDARVFFRAGNVYWAASPTPRARLGDRLVNADLLSQDELERTLEAQRTSQPGTKLGALLVERGLVSRDAIRVFVLEQILDAVFEMVQWREGTYAFRAGEVADEKLPVDIPVDQLLVEIARRQSEWDQIQSAIPDLDMVPDFVRGGSSAHAALEPDEFAVLASVDGARSIRELADALGYSTFEAARIVYGLILLGIVDVRGDGDDDRSDAADDGDAGADVDVGSALEEALGASAAAAAPPAPAADRPRVRLHVDDDVRDYVPPREATTADPSAPDATTTPGGPATETSGPPQEDQPEAEPSATPAPVAEPSVAADRSIEDLTAALTAALGEPTTADAPPPRDVPPEAEEGRDEPEPWVAADDPPAPSSAEDVGSAAGPTAPSPARGRDLPDDEFDALLDELSEAPTNREHAVAEPEPAPAEHRRGSGSSDVSEFLRELSQLAVDEPPPNANPGPTAPKAAPDGPPADEPPGEDDGPPARPSREEDRRAAAEKRDDRNKKRGLFGWGR